MDKPRDHPFTVVQDQVRLADPHVNTDNRDLLSIRSAIYDALVSRDERGGFRPALATDWTCSADARTWTFQVRGGVHFHDGTLLSAGDVVASLERVRDPSRGGEMGTQGVYQSYLSGAKIEALDPRRVRIVTAEPMADLLDLLVDLPIIPRDLRDGPERNPIGTGPFRVVGADTGSLSMEAFADHWAGRPPHRSVRWVAEPDEERRVSLLLTGVADVIANVSPSAQQAIQGSRVGTVQQAQSSTCVAFICNASSGPCADPRVRQALNYGVDVVSIIREVVDGQAQALNGPLTPLHLGYDPLVPPYPYDPERARRLLVEAGYGSGLELLIDIPTSMPDEAPALAERLTTNYTDLGVTVRVRAFESRPAYAEMVRAKQIGDACCFDSTPLSTFRVLREKIHGGIRGPWWQGYRNPTVDALLNRAAATPAVSEREGLYRQAYRHIREDAPWIFLYSTCSTWGCREGINWKPSTDGLIHLA